MNTHLCTHHFKCHMLEVLDNISIIQSAFFTQYDFLMNHSNLFLWAIPENSFENFINDQKMRVLEQEKTINIQSIDKENNNKIFFLFLKVVRFKKG